MLRRRESHIRTGESRQSWWKGSLTMAKNKSRDLASDIIDAVREGTKKMDPDREGGGAQPRLARLPHVPDDARARHIDQGGGGADHGRCLSAGERQRRAASQATADHACGATAHSEGDRKAARRQLFHPGLAAGLHRRTWRRLGCGLGCARAFYRTARWGKLRHWHIGGPQLPRRF